MIKRSSRWTIFDDAMIVISTIMALISVVTASWGWAIWMTILVIIGIFLRTDYKKEKDNENFRN